MASKRIEELEDDAAALPIATAAPSSGLASNMAAVSDRRSQQQQQQQKKPIDNRAAAIIEQFRIRRRPNLEDLKQAMTVGTTAIRRVNLVAYGSPRAKQSSKLSERETDAELIKAIAAGKVNIDVQPIPTALARKGSDYTIGLISGDKEIKENMLLSFLPITHVFADVEPVIKTRRLSDLKELDPVVDADEIAATRAHHVRPIDLGGGVIGVNINTLTDAFIKDASLKQSNYAVLSKNHSLVGGFATEGPFAHFTAEYVKVFLEKLARTRKNGEDEKVRMPESDEITSLLAAYVAFVNPFVNAAVTMQTEFGLPFVVSTKAIKPNSPIIVNRPIGLIIYNACLADGVSQGRAKEIFDAVVAQASDSSYLESVIKPILVKEWGFDQEQQQQPQH
ncbi:MAG: hypothetical protein WC763_05545 [Candidatus Paceibacterota bacterium]|jgi:hypothetical protein